MSTAPDAPARRMGALYWQLAGALALVALVVAGWLWARAAGLDLAALTPEDVRAFVHAWGRWSAAGAVLLMVVHSFVPLPAEIIAIASGLMFGPLAGTAVTWSGAMLGAVLSYALARWLGLAWARHLIDAQRLDRWRAAFATPSTLLVIRLMPIVSFNLINYGAGLLGVPWWRFLWTTALGILPLTVAFVVLGDHAMYAPWWLWTIVAVAFLALSLLLPLLRRRIARTTVPTR